MIPLEIGHYLKHAIRDREPMATADAVALVETPERWIGETTNIEELFAAWLAIHDKIAALDFAARELGPDKYRAGMASGTVRMTAQQYMQRPDPLETGWAEREFRGLNGGLVHWTEFDMVLRLRAGDESFNPFAPVLAAMFAIEEQPAGVTALSQRLELLWALNDRQAAFHAYVSASSGSFWTVPRASESAAALEMAGTLGEAVMATERAFEEAKAEAGTRAAEDAAKRARELREEGDKRREEERRARQARIDAEREEAEAEAEAARLRAMASVAA